MIFYDIKSLTWYPTISWTVSETRTFLQTLGMKITTEIQRDVKLQLRAKILRGYTFVFNHAWMIIVHIYDHLYALHPLLKKFMN